MWADPKPLDSEDDLITRPPYSFPNILFTLLLTHQTLILTQMFLKWKLTGPDNILRSMGKKQTDRQTDKTVTNGYQRNSKYEDKWNFRVKINQYSQAFCENIFK